jgi:membrane protease YdiL (CAAX protease family)
VIAPLSEEFTFRACMLPLLLQCMSPLSAVLLSPLLFGIGKTKISMFEGGKMNHEC